MTAKPFDANIHEMEIAGARDLSRRFSTDVRAHFKERLRDIRLYGSAARGDWSQESDIDVLILLDRVERGDGEWIVKRAVALGLMGAGLLLQPLFMPEADFKRLKSRERRFALDIMKEGIPL